MIYYSNFGSGQPGSNPNFANNVRLLCGFNGSDGATATTNEWNGASATFAGNAQLDTAEKRYGSASLLLDGNGDFISFPDSGNWDIGPSTEALQVEASIRFAAAANLGNAHTIISQYEASFDQRSWALSYVGSLGRLQFRYTTGGATLLTMVEYSWTPTVETWYDICVSRVGSTARIFIDGQIVATNTDSGNPHNGNAPLRIGALSSGGATNFFHGWIDEVRFAKEVVADSGGFNTANYTPAEFPRS